MTAILRDKRVQFGSLVYPKIHARCPTEFQLKVHYLHKLHGEPYIPDLPASCVAFGKVRPTFYHHCHHQNPSMQPSDFP
jgi:hypothetical protein